MAPHRLLIAGCLALSAIFGWLFYVRYWKWRDCIREADSSCTTPDGDNLTSGGLIWGLLAAILAAVAIRIALKMGGRGPTPPFA